MNIKDFRFPLRIHYETNEGSVYDVIEALDGSNKNLRKRFDELPKDLKQQCKRLKINGKGQSLPVASAKVVLKVIEELPGNISPKIRNMCAEHVRRIMKYQDLDNEKQEQEQEEKEEKQEKQEKQEKNQISLKRKVIDIDTENKLEDLRQKCAENEIKNNRERFNLIVHKCRMYDHLKKLSIFSQDAHLMTLLKENIMESLKKGNQKIELKFAPSISCLLQEEGFSNKKVYDLRTSCGTFVAEKYRKEFGQEPKVSSKYCNGEDRYVNTYEDSEWLREKVKEFAASIK
jgi:hypothetical protein